MAVDQQDRRYWMRSATIAVVLAAVTGGLVVLPVLYIGVLNRYLLFGFPLGFILPAQIVLIALAIAAFWFARAQERIDRSHGVTEDV